MEGFLEIWSTVVLNKISCKQNLVNDVKKTADMEGDLMYAAIMIHSALFNRWRGTVQ